MKKLGLMSIGLLLASVLLGATSTPGAAEGSGAIAVSSSIEDTAAAAAVITKKVTYTLRIGSRSGDRVVFPVKISGPGSVMVRVTWTGTARNLAVYLDGSSRAYGSVTGRSPLSLSYNITRNDFGRGGSWSIRLVNNNGGSATGQVVISYPG